MFHTQESLNDLIKDLGLPKDAAEHLASDLKKRNLLMKETQSTVYQTIEKAFLSFFSREFDLVYCSDVIGLVNKLKSNVYKDEEWRIFIDSSQRSLKAVLIHNTNKFASIPIAHSTILKESYVNMEKVLSVIEYSEHNWMMCGDLKIVTILLGQQSGFTKHPCFLCLWESRDRKNHYKKQPN